jgi:hypothetical protein
MDAVPDAIEIAASLEEPFDVPAFLAFARNSGLARGASLTEDEAARAIAQLQAMALVKRVGLPGLSGEEFELTKDARAAADGGLLFPLA